LLASSCHNSWSVMLCSFLWCFECCAVLVGGDAWPRYVLGVCLVA